MIVFRKFVTVFCLLIAVQTHAANPVKLELPRGFTATVFANDIGPARHLVVRENGDVYVTLRRAADGKGVVGLRDTDGDGVAD
ncbi:MAG: sorbosone dehydrogenase, partial [Gammaproteobacteria bacterium]|nr:sorbosone dehydrogenase [Gammaproteobacteria bacterium]